MLRLFTPLLEDDAGFAAQAQALGLATPTSIAPIECERLRQLMTAAAERQGEDAGLQLAHALPLNALGSVGLYLLSAADLREMLIDLHRYWPLLRPQPATLEISIDEQRVSLGVRPGADRAERQLLEAGLLCLLRLLRAMYGAELKPSAICYPVDCPAPPAWRQLLDLPVQQQGELLALQLPASWLDREPRAAKAGLRDALRPKLEAELQRIRDERSWAQRLHAALAARPSLAGVSLAKLAVELGLGGADLAQRLAAEQTDFEAVLASLRRERALQRLLAAEVDSDTLAAELGYSERSAFETQFQQWFQTSPSALRSDALAAGFDPRSGAAARYEDLPPAPQTCRTLIELRYLEEAPLDEIVAAVEPDPALTAKVIGAAGSAFYGARKVRDLRDAIGRVLGLNELIRIATVLSARQALQPSDCPDFDLLAFWSRSLAVAHSSAALLQQSGAAIDIEATRLLGLFHDLGLQVLAYHAGARLQAHLQALPEQASERAIRQAELRDLGTTRHIAGSILLAHWGLPPDVVGALRDMDQVILDPHAEVGVEIRLIVALSRYFRRRYESLPVEQEALDILRVLAGAELPPLWSAEELMAELDETLESRRLQAEELLS